MNAIELKGRGVLAEGLARAEIQGENGTVNGVGELKLREVRLLAQGHLTSAWRNRVKVKEHVHGMKLFEIRINVPI